MAKQSSTSSFPIIYYTHFSNFLIVIGFYCSELRCLLSEIRAVKRKYRRAWDVFQVVMAICVDSRTLVLAIAVILRHLKYTLDLSSRLWLLFHANCLLHLNAIFVWFLLSTRLEIYNCACWSGWFILQHNRILIIALSLFCIPRCFVTIRLQSTWKNIVICWSSYFLMLAIFVIIFVINVLIKLLLCLKPLYSRPEFYQKDFLSRTFLFWIFRKFRENADQ